MAEWRRVGWQQMQAVVPAEWFLSKIGTDRTAGELWLADEAMPRLQVKWLDTAKQKSIDPSVTLENYLRQLEKQAKKRSQRFGSERGLKLIGKGKRDISSLEGFHWSAETQAYGVIWYSPSAQRVTLAQVNGALDDPACRTVARQVLGSLTDTADAEGDLWTAYDLECRLASDWVLTGQRMETGRTELRFGWQKDTVSFSRVGLAEIALQRAGDLGDWAFSQCYKEWSSFRLERAVGQWQGHPAVTFVGPRRSLGERARQRCFRFVGLPYPFLLAARVWHCVERNCLYLVETIRDRRSPDRLDSFCATVPDSPAALPAPKL
ncbi:MAG: hypothetical protein IT204_11665 [Fimbriimonadaceae bacterium]|nr:hypothetical protein [Fimbriimonadaceae bacterium]